MPIQTGAPQSRPHGLQVAAPHREGGGQTGPSHNDKPRGVIVDVVQVQGDHPRLQKGGGLGRAVRWTVFQPRPAATSRAAGAPAVAR